MQSKGLQEEIEKLVETLAAMEHERWSHWQKYMHSRCERTSDGSLIIPSELVARWEKQIATPYQNLSESEKDSDRDQVQRYLPLITDTLSKIQAK